MTIDEAIRQTKFTSAQQRASLNIIFTASWLQGIQNDFFKSFGITGHQFNILRILRGQYPAKISGTEIRSRMLDQNSDVSRLLDRLVLKKLIVKSQCPNDKRAADIQIADLGLELLARIDKSAPTLDGFVGKLSDDEANQLSDLLDKSRGD